jgi:homoserine O-acetyltransferase
MPGQSVGVVQSQRAHFDEPLQLRSGGVLPAYDLVYETYGSLNAAKSNAILVCHALSGHHHVAGYYADQPDNIGWWDNIVGPGRRWIPTSSLLSD